MLHGAQKQTKKTACNFLANFADRPGICSNRQPIRANPGTIAKIRQKVACQFFRLFSVHRKFLRPSVRPKNFRPSVRLSAIFPSVRPSENFPSVHPKIFGPPVHPSVRPSVHASVRPSVRPSVRHADASCWLIASLHDSPEPDALEPF